MPNVKPGDVCIVLGATLTPELNGRIVNVLSAYNGQKIINIDGRLFAQEPLAEKCWVCSSSTDLPLSRIMKDSGKVISTLYVPIRSIKDSILYKINDQDLDEEMETTDNLNIDVKV